MELTFNFKGDLYCVKDYSCIHMPTPMPMPIPICQYRDFEVAVFWILSVQYGKEGVSSRDGKFVWFSIFFNAYQAFWRDFQSEQDKPYLSFICSKATIKTLEQDMKHV